MPWNNKKFKVTPRSLQNLLEHENVQRIPFGFWERQITNGQATLQAVQAVKDKRQRLLRWMFEVCTHSKCEMAVFPHAVKLLDRFLSNTPCREENLQAVGGACVLLASKFRETTPLGIKRVCQLTQGAVSEDMIKDVEIIILMKLKWDISCPTYIEFLPFIYDILDSSLQEDIGKGNQENKKMSDHLRSEEFRQYVNKYIDKLAALCYWQEPDLITKPPSVIAVQCVSVFFMQQDYLKTRTITSALTPYIPTMTNRTDMQVCWDTAMLVWAGYATDNRRRGQGGRTANQQQANNSQQPTSNVTPRNNNNSRSHNPTVTKHQVAENPAAMDSGNYSGE